MFEQRYETSIEEAFKSAFERSLPKTRELGSALRNVQPGKFFSELAKARSFFRPREFLTVLKDLYGFEAGLVATTMNIIRNRRLKDAGVIQTFYRLVDGPEISRTKAMLRDDRVTVASDSIFLCFKRGIEPEKGLVEVFESLSKEEAKQVEADFRQRYSAKMGQAGLREVLKDRFRGDKADYLIALFDKDDELANAVMLHQGLESKKVRLTACKQLLELEADELQAARERYEAHYGEALDANNKQLEGKDQLLGVLKALLEGDELKAAAIRLDWVLSNPKKGSVEEVFYEHTGQENDRIIAAFEEHIGPFWKRAEKKLGEERCIILRSLVNNGQLSDEEFIRDCMIGFGCDAEGLLHCLEGKSPEEQQSLARRYSEKFSTITRNPLELLAAAEASAISTLSACLEHKSLEPLGWFPSLFKIAASRPRDIDKDIREELGGHDKFDALMLRRGKANSPEEGLKRLEERIKHERSSILTVLFSLRSAEGRRMRADIQAVRDYYREELRGQEATPEKEQRFVFLSKLARQNFDAYRETKDWFGNALANTGSLAVLIAVPSMMLASGATLSWAAYTKAALVTFGASFLARSVSKRATKGHGYPLKEMAIDGVLSVIDGAMLYLNKARLISRLKFAGKPLGKFTQHVMRTVLKVALKKTLKDSTLSAWDTHRGRTSKHVESTDRLKRLEEERLRGTHLMRTIRKTGHSVDAELAADELQEKWKIALNG